MLLMPHKTPRPSARNQADAFGLADPARLPDRRAAARPDGHLLPPADDRRDYEELIDTVKSSLWGLLDAPADGDVGTAPSDEQDRVRSTAIEGAMALERLKWNLAEAFEARDQL